MDEWSLCGVQNYWMESDALTLSYQPSVLI